jgi:tryptophan 2,3-dioxygenase
MAGDGQGGKPGAPGSVATENGPPAVYNARGVIAESYYDLQGLGVIAAARHAYPVPKASGESALQAIFQTVEIALLNLADIVNRAGADLDREDLGGAVVKMFWARGFHRVLSRLSMLPQQLSATKEPDEGYGFLRIADSPAFREYLQVLARFDRSLLRRVETGELRLENTVAEESLDSAEFNLVHLARVSNHESTLWEENLREVPVPAVVPSYERFVVADGMRDVVYDRTLTGDTYFTQFRGLHQIPEILGEELNDRLEQAVRDIRDGRLQQAVDYLASINVLAEGIMASLPPMVDNLATSDYHQIRENLGLTSGSHSVCLRYHMFTHLYEQLWEELSHEVSRWSPGASFGSIEAAVREVDRQRSTDPTAWLVHALFRECLRFRAFVLYWRGEHLNLPRNNLGGEGTKSLTGSPDAIQAVRQMRDVARARDAMLPLARARGLSHSSADQEPGELTQYLESDASLDTYVLAATGRTTQRRFHDVQERLGFFANRCPFSSPPRRRA